MASIFGASPTVTLTPPTPPPPLPVPTVRVLEAYATFPKVTYRVTPS